MKKFVSVIMTLVMVAALYVPVKAEDQQVTETEYLDVEPGAYIDTECRCDYPHIVMDIYMTGEEAYYFGAYDYLGTTRRVANGYGLRYDTDLCAEYASNEEYFRASIQLGMRHTLEYDNYCVKFDGRSFFEQEKNFRNIDSNIYLFAYNVAGSPQISNNQGMIKFYSCKIYDGDTLVRDFVPAKCGNEVGVLDRCENKFYGSKGSGKMTTGSERECIVGSENVNFAEYAVVGKNAYFDTGYFPNNNTRIVLDIDANKSNGSLFGSMIEHALIFHDEGMFFWEYKFAEYVINKYENRMVAGNGVESAKEFTVDLSDGRHVIEYCPSGVIIDGENVCEYERIGISSPPSLYLFGTHVEEFAIKTQIHESLDTIEHPSGADGTVTFYSCQIYEGDTLIHDYIPAVLKSDGTPVVFDKVAGVSHGYGGFISNVTSVNVSEDGGYFASAFSDGNGMLIIILMIIIIGCGAAIIIYKMKKNPQR